MTDADLIARNRAAWDVRAEQHLASSFYDVDAWLRGANSLKPPELALLGELSGRRLLHLQCHFGQDTLSLARRGAEVVGLDFSGRAIAAARDLARRAGLAAQFHEVDVLTADRHPPLAAQAGTFDVAFASYGTIGWLPDIDRWAAVVAHFLRPGGRLVFVEFHPLADLYGPHALQVPYGYFGGAPTLETEGTYTDVAEERPMPTAFWDHPVSAVVQALLDVGLQLERFAEYDYSPYDIYGERGVERAPGEWQLRGLEGRVPLLYSLTAKRVLPPGADGQPSPRRRRAAPPPRPRGSS